MKGLAVIGISLFFLMSLAVESPAQCSICTKTAQQMGEAPAKALNTGIVYLMMTPFAVVGFIAYRWWRNNRG